MRNGNQAIMNQLNQLPLRALAAFAVRCTRRVEDWGSGAALEATGLAEQFARGRTVLAADAARAAARAEACAAKVRAELDQVAGAGSRVAVAYRSAAAHTAAAFTARTIVSATGAPLAALTAARVAADVDPRIQDAVAVDLQKLLGLDLGSFPELGGPLDPSEAGPLGPLWPQSGRDRVRDAGSFPRPTPLAIPS
jgi:hypothetical protein